MLGGQWGEVTGSQAKDGEERARALKVRLRRGLPGQEDDEWQVRGPRTGKSWWEWGFLVLILASCLWQVAGFAQVLIDTSGLSGWGTACPRRQAPFLPLPPPCCRPLLLPVAPMAEEWLDCPALGPGWKRREVFRKSGATCGRSDTYYQRYWLGCGQSQG